MIIKTGIHWYCEDISIGTVSFQFMNYPGASEMVVFLHGLGCSSDSFRYLFDAPYFPGKSLLLVDFLGFGRSSKPEKFPYTMESQASAVEEVLSLLPSIKIHIVAHSMGGAIALLLSEQIFHRMISFANIEGNLIAEDCGLLSRSIANIPYESYSGEIFEKQKAEYAGHRQIQFENSEPDALYKSAVSLVKWSDSGKLLNIFLNLKCNKCYFYGEENKKMFILEKLTDIPRIMITSSGHGMMTENPCEFYSSLASFINS